MMWGNQATLSPLRIGNRSYDISQGALNILNDQGGIIKTTRIPVDDMTPGWRRTVDANWKSYHKKTSEKVLSQECSWHKVYDKARQRILASNQMMPGWVMAADLDGTVQWLTFTGPQCCNFACIIGFDGRIFHGSSCGRRLTILAQDGTELSRTELSLEWWPSMCVSDGQEGVCFLTAELMLRYDESGELTWKVPHKFGLRSDLSRNDISHLIKQGRNAQ